jgi:hypothetical protein
MAMPPQPERFWKRVDTARSGLPYGLSSRITRAATTCCRRRCTPLTGSIMWKLSRAYGHGRGLVASLNRPGGNLTGVTGLSVELVTQKNE